MKKNILRGLALSVASFFGFIAYSEYTNPVLYEGRQILMIITNLVMCGILLHYAITGNRKPFFPKWVPFFPKKKDK